MIMGYFLGIDDRQKFEFLKNERGKLWDKVWELQPQLNELVEEYEDTLNGGEESVLTLVQELKKLLETIDGLNYEIFQLIGATGNAEERKRDKERQKELKDDVSETLFNAKYFFFIILKKMVSIFFSES